MGGAKKFRKQKNKKHSNINAHVTCLVIFMVFPCVEFFTSHVTINRHAHLLFRFVITFFQQLTLIPPNQDTSRFNEVFSIV